MNAWEKDYRSRGHLWAGGVKDLPQMPEGSAVLELGCGNGKTLSAMLRRPWSITALDISIEAIRLSRRDLSEKVALLVADARLLPFRDESFDAVFAFHVAGHLLISEREKLAIEASRVLKEKGLLFFRGFGMGDLRAGAGVEVEPGTFMRGQGIVTHYFSESEVAGLFGLMKPISVGTSEWKIRIKGEDFTRSEVEAVFQRAAI